ncbi:MAG: DUF3800 domain-containing protein, partial [Gammaproteobacteria bacterium]|nr:DUF3800 domain-containing protein [Gammaproteobacteria bacterium]
MGPHLKICFIDESGDLGALRDPPAPNDQPVLVIAGLFVDGGRLANLTHEYLDLKHRFFPNLNYPSTLRLDRVLPEIKGAELRKHATRGNARQKLHAVGFVDRIMGLLRRHEARVVARVWVKALGSELLSNLVYGELVMRRLC